MKTFTDRDLDILHTLLQQAELIPGWRPATYRNRDHVRSLLLDLTGVVSQMNLIAQPARQSEEHLYLANWCVTATSYLRECYLGEKPFDLHEYREFQRKLDSVVCAVTEIVAELRDPYDGPPCPTCGDERDDCPECSGPKFCDACHEPIEADDKTVAQMMDLDPGNPEVGPQPDIRLATVHERCSGVSQ